MPKPTARGFEISNDTIGDTLITRKEFGFTQEELSAATGGEFHQEDVTHFERMSDAEIPAQLIEENLRLMERTFVEIAFLQQCTMGDDAIFTAEEAIEKIALVLHRDRHLIAFSVH